jgi:hypothetical protein
MTRVESRYAYFVAMFNSKRTPERYSRRRSASRLRGVICYGVFESGIRTPREQKLA